MIDFQQRRSFRKFFYSKITLFFLVIFIFFMAKQVYEIYLKNKISRESLSIATKNYEALKTREKMLSLEIERLKTEAGIEEEIRNKYNVARPGEEVVVIVDKEKESSSTKENKTEGFWQKFLNFFK
jgi:cell division protein FtsB